MKLSHKSRYPLASLFLLVGCIALALAGLEPWRVIATIAGEPFEKLLLTDGSFLAFLFALVGAIAGCRPGRRIRGAALGFVAGWVTGALVVVRLISPPDFPPLLVGSVVLLGACVAYRLSVRKSDPERLPEREKILQEVRASIRDERAANEQLPVAPQA